MRRGFLTLGGRKFPYGNFRTTRVLRSQNTDCRRNVSFATVLYQLYALFCAGSALADDERRLARSGDRCDRTGNVLCCDSQHQTCAHVERIVHIALRDLTGLCDQVEYRRNRNGLLLDLRDDALRQHARHVLIKAAAGDVADALDVYLADERLDRLDVDLGRGQQLLAEALAELIDIAAEPTSR